MARQLKRLTARTVATLTKPGRHADGGNLYLAISKTSTGLSRRWTFMYAFGGKQREGGFGSASTVTLAEARERAAEYRSQLAKGIDPLMAKQSAKAADAARRTFGQCADDLIDSMRPAWRSEIHARQWRNTIDTYCKSILDTFVDEIDVHAVLAVLKPIWGKIPETASRLRGRIESILNFAKAHKLRAGENPAAWKGNLADILPKRQKLMRGHHAAMPYRDVADFIGRLRERESIPALALEFTILTAARLGEAIGARWSEIDIEGRIWCVPASRMKGGLSHRVPLPGRAIEIVERMAAIRSGDYVFPSHRRGRPLGQAAIRSFCPAGATTHGFRSSFRDWAGNETSFPRELAEQALAHATGNAVGAAYRRGDALEKRRVLMDAWANYCEPGAAGNVVPIRGVL
jgi:integrase